MGVPQYTTPTICLSFDDSNVDLTMARNVIVTFRSGKYSLSKTGADLEVTAKEIFVRLTQQETAQMEIGDVDVMANWMVGDNRMASKKVQFNITDQLYKAVIE